MKDVTATTPHDRIKSGELYMWRITNVVSYIFSSMVAVISISIGANYRGFGLAPCLLEKALRHFHDRERQISKIYAYVKTENMASRYAFIRAGFKDCVSDNKHALKYCYVYGN